MPELQLGSGYTTTGGIDPAARRLWALESLARGARTLCWFHWRRFRGGCEWRLTSVVERDRKKRLIFNSLQQVIGEVRAIEPLLAGAKVAGDVQVLYSLDNALAHDRASEPLFWMEIQLPDASHNRFNLWEKELRRAVYNPLSCFGLTLDFVSESQPWAVDKPLIATDFEIVSDETLIKLRRFCEDGGTFICFPGAGERDEHGCQRDAPPPGNLRELLGVELHEYYPIDERGGSVFDNAAGSMTRPEGELERQTTARIAVDGEALPDVFEADVRHGEVLDVIDAEVIGRYRGGPCDGQPAISRRRIGKGCAIYLGATPRDVDEACRLYRAILPELTRETVDFRSVKLDTPSGPFAFHINDAPRPCPLPTAVGDVISGERFEELPAYGVVLVKL